MSKNKDKAIIEQLALFIKHGRCDYDCTGIDCRTCVVHPHLKRGCSLDVMNPQWQELMLKYSKKYPELVMEVLL